MMSVTPEEIEQAFQAIMEVIKSASMPSGMIDRKFNHFSLLYVWSVIDESSKQTLLQELGPENFRILRDVAAIGVELGLLPVPDMLHTLVEGLLRAIRGEFPYPPETPEEAADKQKHARGLVRRSKEHAWQLASAMGFSRARMYDLIGVLSHVDPAILGFTISSFTTEEIDPEGPNQ